jgi:hypothetical protein
VFPNVSIRTATGLPTLEPAAGRLTGPPPTIVVMFWASSETLPKIRTARAHKAKRKEFFIDDCLPSMDFEPNTLIFWRNNCLLSFSDSRKRE